jgi:hypothetical protein
MKARSKARASIFRRFRTKVAMRLLPTLMLSALTMGLSGEAESTAAALNVTYVNVGTMIPSSPKMIGRDGGFSFRIGDKSLWLFGDTFTTDGLRSATAGLTSATDPVHLQDLTDENGVPLQFIPFTPDEIAFNQQPGNPRLALWPLMGVAAPGSVRGSVYYIKLLVYGPLDYQIIGTGTASVRLVSSAAGSSVRVHRDSNLIFGRDEPIFAPAFTEKVGAVTFLYLYSEDAHVARVPLLGLRRRSSYRFWNGSSWSADVNEAVALFSTTSPWSTVAQNSYLKGYVRTESTMFDNRLYIRTAPLPEGSWSDPALAVDIGAPAGAEMFFQHPEYGDGQSFLLSYVVWVQPSRSEFRLVRVTLQQASN